MKDLFALLDLPRRPWIDPEALKAKYIALSAAAHPDRVHEAQPDVREAAQQGTADLNVAYQCLKDPRRRLHHLLELERGSPLPDTHELPASVTDLFADVHQVLQGMDKAIQARNSAHTAVAKARLFEETLPWMERLHSLQNRIGSRLTELDNRLRQLNLAWESAPAPGSPLRVNMLPCSRLDHLCREISFLQRWHQQLQERAVQISF